MGFTNPIYNSEETKGLSEDQLRQLKEAILREVDTNPEIRRLLKEKTQSLYNSLPKKP